MTVKKIVDYIIAKDLGGLEEFYQSNQHNIPEFNDWFDRALDVLEVYDPQAFEEFFKGEGFKEVSQWIDRGIRFNYIQLILANRPIEKGFPALDSKGEIVLDGEDYSILRRFTPADLVNDTYKPQGEGVQELMIELIERRLGVPFFKNLAILVKTRLSLIKEECIGYYLEELIGGIQSRTHVNMLELLKDEIPAEFKEMIGYGRETSTYILDILAAQGETDCLMLYGREGILTLTDRAVERLNIVYNPFWRGVIDSKMVTMTVEGE